MCNFYITAVESVVLHKDIVNIYLLVILALFSKKNGKKHSNFGF